MIPGPEEILTSLLYTHREHLDAIITSAVLRGEPNDAHYARMALDMQRMVADRVMYLTLALRHETVGGDRGLG